jgi:hypothetical protein
MKVNAILLKPLDGYEPGSPRQFEKADFDRLFGMNAVKEAGAEDPVEDVPASDDARILEQLRHPVEGPKMLADMKMSFDRQGLEITRLAGDLTTATASVEALTVARDEAVRSRDAALLERDQARDAAAVVENDRDALQRELDQLRAIPSEQGEQAGASKATKQAKPSA